MQRNCRRPDARIVVEMRLTNLAAFHEREKCSATAFWPGCGRASCKRGSNAAGVPFSASRLIAPETSATRASASHEKRQSADRVHRLGAVEQGEAFLRFQLTGFNFGAPQRFGARHSFAFGKCLAFADHLNARCASGARSPLAPTEPFSGITGCTRRLSISQSISMTRNEFR